MSVHFRDRADAGRRLAEALAALHLADPVIEALPRGGVPVAAEVAVALRAPIDLVIVRKIGAPGDPELALGAVSEVDGQPQLAVDEAVRECFGVARATIDEQARREMSEIERRRRRYLAGAPSVPVHGCTAILVDDGIATGSSVRVAARVLTLRGPRALVLAVPVAPAEVLDELRPLFDRIVCLRRPDPFYSVGYHYDDFRQVGDEEVIGALARARDARAAAQPEPLSDEGSSAPSMHCAVAKGNAPS